MSNSRKVDVDVYIDDPKSKPPIFRVVGSPKNNPPLPIGPDRELEFENNGHKGFRIHFNLQGDTHGFFFPPNSKKREAIWSEFGSEECPKGPDGVWEVFKPIEVKKVAQERRTLVVHNKNECEDVGQFLYTLRVTKDKGVTYLPLDPGGNNKNGPTLALNLNTAIADTLLVAGFSALMIFAAAAGANLIDNNVSVGFALLIALTGGFAISGVLFRLMPRTPTY